MRYTEIDNLIELIIKEYEQVNNNWNASQDNLINLKSCLVVDIIENQEIFKYILNYRSFLSDYFNALKFSITDVSTRVKAQNSLESKIQRYIFEKKEKGKMPINKCINDLFGLRIIIDDEIDFQDLKDYIQAKYNLKCIDAKKKDYIAYHVYFKKEKDNTSFPWELQIWKRGDVQGNFKSHHKYKQDYAQWEKQLKGG